MSKNKARTSIKSPLRYPGGKTRAIKILEKLKPYGVRRMLSPFIGGGSFESTLTRAEEYDFIFLDPPYELPNPSLYGTSGDAHKGFPHQLLADLVRDVDAPWLMTYNDTEEVRARYKGFNLTETSWAYGMNISKKSSELIITNYPVEGESNAN